VCFRRPFSGWLAVVSAVVALASPLASPQASPLGSAAWAAVADAGQKAAAPSEYRLGPGDTVRITTFGEPTLSGLFEVSGSGRAALPLVGEVKAEGLTAAEFGRVVEAAFRDGFLKEPKVSIEVAVYRPFYILGEVGKPGQYPFTNGLTVLNAVATANGFTYRADTRHVFIKHAKDAVEHRVDLTTSTLVEPGDTLRIKERYF
jgi:protein involved in polysaccharide export with SLBB domain